MNNTTYSPKKAEIQSNWYIIDAANKPLGRVATEVAKPELSLCKLYKKEKSIYLTLFQFVDILHRDKARKEVCDESARPKKVSHPAHQPGRSRRPHGRRVLCRHGRLRDHDVYRQRVRRRSGHPGEDFRQKPGFHRGADRHHGRGR